MAGRDLFAKQEDKKPLGRDLFATPDLPQPSPVHGDFTADVVGGDTRGISQGSPFNEQGVTLPSYVEPVATIASSMIAEPVAGIAGTVLSDTEKGYLKGKEGNIYNEVGGVNIFEEGVVVSGEFIDIIRGTAYLEVNIQADVYQGLVSVDKVPFTNAGIDVVKNLVLAVLNSGVDMGILTDDPAPVVTAPDVSEVSTADKAARFLDNVEFTAVFSGAIHKTTIVGVISV